VATAAGILQGTKLTRKTLNETIAEAGRVPIGVAWKAEKGFLALAVRDGHRVVAGVARGESPDQCDFEELGDKWHPELERNLVRLMNWTRGTPRVALRRPEKVEPVGAEERALLDDCVAAPKDDAPRLVYADWLAQKDDPRGELIALQCQLERLRKAAPERVRLNARGLRIVEAHPSVPGTLPIHGLSWQRGFVTWVKLTAAELAKKDLFLRQPLVESLTLDSTSGRYTLVDGLRAVLALQLPRLKLVGIRISPLANKELGPDEQALVDQLKRRKLQVEVG
jgi:uncharacterized protein (TIGR02996 family)